MGLILTTKDPWTGHGEPRIGCGLGINNFYLDQLNEHKKYLEQKYDSKNKHGCIWTCSKCNQGFKSKSGLSIHYNYCVGSKELFLRL